MIESILVPQDNGERKILKVLYEQISKTCCFYYGYELVCVGDKFSKPFKSYLGEDTI